MQVLLNLVLAWMLALMFASSCTEAICSTDYRNYKHFGEKTFYNVTGGELPSMSERAPASCEPIHMYMILRHGARYPGKQILPTLEKLKSLTSRINETGKAGSCDEDLEALRRWEIWTDEYDNKNQTEYGGQEMEGIAQRYKELFPTILGSSVPVRRFWFSSTDFQRTRDSLASFKDELLRVPNDETASAARVVQAVVEIPDGETDPVFAGNCRKYKANVLGNKAAAPMYQEFITGPLYRNVAQNVARRLGIRRSAITRSMLFSMYSEGCSYQQWVERQNGPWCKIFKPHDLRIMEFAMDIKAYELKGLKIPLAYQKNCIVSKDIVGSLKNARSRDMNGEEYLAGKFRVLHVSNILTSAANFQLYNYKNEEAPNAHNYRSLRRRKYKLSKMIPTAGHLNFVLYRCGEGDYKVQVYWNERIVQIPGCSSAKRRLGSLCDLDDVLEMYPNFIYGSDSECDQEEIFPCPPYVVFDLVTLVHASNNKAFEDISYTESLGFRDLVVSRDKGNMYAKADFSREVHEWGQVTFNQTLFGTFTPDNERPPYQNTADGKVNNGKAMTWALNNLVGPGSGDRPRVRDILLIGTDSSSDDDVTAPARAWREKGALIYVMAFPNQDEVLPDRNEMMRITEGQEHIFYFRGNRTAAAGMIFADTISHFCTNICDHVLHDHE